MIPEHLVAFRAWLEDGGNWRNRTRAGPKKHGKYGSSEYHSWAGMKQRCLNPRHPQYADYGGRGITVCDRWLSFEKFYIDMGDKLDHALQIDRIDNGGGYNPANCRWATPKQNSNNRRPRRLKEKSDERR